MLFLIIEQQEERTKHVSKYKTKNGKKLQLQILGTLDAHTWNK